MADEQWRILRNEGITGIEFFPVRPYPYTPPQTMEIDPFAMRRSQKRIGWAAILCAFGVVLPPSIGLVRVFIAGFNTYSELQKTGSADPAVMAGEVSVMILSILWGLVISCVFLIAMIVCLVKYRRRRKCLREFEEGRATEPKS